MGGRHRQRIQHKDTYRRASSFDRPRSRDDRRRYDNRDGGARPRIQRNRNNNRDDNRKVHGAIKKRYDNKPQYRRPQNNQNYKRSYNNERQSDRRRDDNRYN